VAFVIGPNGRKNFVPDDVAECLVGSGERGWQIAPEPKPEPKPATTRATRKTTAK
jgi:hypothetical protein